jgi:hypothetical protein
MPAFTLGVEWNERVGAVFIWLKLALGVLMEGPPNDLFKFLKLFSIFESISIIIRLRKNRDQKKKYVCTMIILPLYSQNKIIEINSTEVFVIHLVVPQL